MSVVTKKGSRLDQGEEGQGSYSFFSQLFVTWCVWTYTVDICYPELPRDHYKNSRQQKFETSDLFGKCKEPTKLYREGNLEQWSIPKHLLINICITQKLVRGDIHTQVPTLNVNMTLESEILTPPPLTSSVATNFSSFRRKTKKPYF